MEHSFLHMLNADERYKNEQGASRLFMVCYLAPGTPDH
jgi:hypothetical protein